MSNHTANPYRITLSEMLKQEGRTFEAMAEEVMFGTRTRSHFVPSIAR